MREYMSKDSVKRLTIRAHVHTFGGYGWLLCALFDQLTAMGIYVTIRALAVDEQFGPNSAIPLKMRSQFVIPPQPEPWELLISSPDTVPTPGKKTVHFTMYEATEMPQQYVHILNRSECVIVPSAWGKKCFVENGVRVPVHIVPLGVDETIFQPSPILNYGPCVFGIAGRTRHCAKRKAVQETLDLWLETFKGIDGVRAHIKLHSDDNLKECKDPRVKIERSHFEPYQIAQWLHGLTAFVSLARGEGWGLWQHQALACGRPVIACRYSGMADFLPNDYAIPFKEVDAGSGESNVEYLGKWAEPDRKAAARNMGNIQRNRDMAIAAGQRGAESVAHLTWSNSAKRLMSVLNKIGVWK